MIVSWSHLKLTRPHYRTLPRHGTTGKPCKVWGQGHCSFVNSIRLYSLQSPILSRYSPVPSTVSFSLSDRFTPLSLSSLSRLDAVVVLSVSSLDSVLLISAVILTPITGHLMVSSWLTPINYAQYGPCLLIPVTGNLVHNEILKQTVGTDTTHATHPAYTTASPGPGGSGWHSLLLGFLLHFTPFANWQKQNTKLLKLFIFDTNSYIHTYSLVWSEFKCYRGLIIMRHNPKFKIEYFCL